MAVGTRLLQINLSLTSIVGNSSLHNITDLCKFVCNIYLNKRIYTTQKTFIKFNIGHMSKNRRNITTNHDHMKSIPPLVNVDIKNLTNDQIDSFIDCARDSKELYKITYLTTALIKEERIASKLSMTKLFVIYSNAGNISIVKNLQLLYQLKMPLISEKNSNFDLYLAKAHWIKGNVDKSFLILYDVYKKNKGMKITIRNMIRYQIRDVIAKSSEASIIITKKNVVNFALDLNEWSPFMDFWQACWLSEWYKDQQLSEELFNQYSKLRERLGDRIIYIASYALKFHNESSVQNLLELLLQYDMRHQYTLVIGILFDYKYKNDDIKGCSEIMKNCELLKIYLTDIHYEKFIFMKITTDKSTFVSKQNKIMKRPPVDTFKYKF